MNSLFLEKVLTNAKKIDIIVRQVTKRRPVTEKYSSGRRGAPAKGVGRVFPARESKSLLLRHQKTHFCLPTKVRFLNDVCLRQMMTASPNDVRCANDVCLAAHWANIASLRVKRATSFLRSKCIISPQGDASFEDIQGLRLDLFTKVWYN